MLLAQDLRSVTGVDGKRPGMWYCFQSICSQDDDDHIDELICRNGTKKYLGRFSVSFVVLLGRNS